MKHALPNIQPAEKLDRREDGSLEVVEVFPTIQGEGPHAGRPAVFVRLAGCDLTCPICDTDYTTNRVRRTVEDLVQEVESHKLELVVITGGEPFRQNIALLISRLIEAGHRVQVESNGTLFLDQDMLDSLTYGKLHAGMRWEVVCSPKTSRVNPLLLPHITAMKYVMRAGEVDPKDGLPTDVLGSGVRPARMKDIDKRCIFVQPADEGREPQNLLNLQAAVESCMTHGYRLSVQLHKIIGMR